MSPRAAVILAAGQGTRMKSPRPKVLHPVGGRALIDHAIDLAQGLNCERIVVVLGKDAGAIRDHVAARLGEGAIAVQDPPLGTGHAVLAAKDALADFDGDVVVTYGDSALLTPEALAPIFALRDAGADLAVLGFDATDPAPYGRLLLGLHGVLQRIVLALPFAAVYSTPLLIYTGTIAPASYPAAFATQLAWGCGFAVLATFACTVPKLNANGAAV